MSRLLEDPSRSAARRGDATLDVPRGKSRQVGMPLRALGGFATTMSEMLGPRETSAFGILTYHRVTDAVPGRAAPTWNVPPARFQQQLEGLLRRGFEAWPLRKVVSHVREGRPIPRKVFVVTFDDAYENVYLNAFPILRLLGVPATVFLSTAYLDSPDPFPSDEWAQANQGHVPYTAWKPLTTEECRELQKRGLIELAAQTHIDDDFRNQPAELVADFRRCQRVLRERFGIERASFAFTYGDNYDGDASAELSSAAEEAGVLCGLTTKARLVRPGDSPYDWGRFAAEECDTAASLAAKLSGWYEVVRSFSQLIPRRTADRTATRPWSSPDAETERT
jgi:peptidoglycan/xylan/chitin deacetylase (PgdA/CDA1 family)